MCKELFWRDLKWVCLKINIEMFIVNQDQNDQKDLLVQVSRNHLMETMMQKTKN